MRSPVLAITVAFSAAIHVAAAGGLHGFFGRPPAAIVAELDLSMVPLTPAKPNPGGRVSKPKETWAPPRKDQPVAPAPEKAEVAEDPGDVDAQEGPAVDGTPAGTGEGAYVPASATSRKPRWVGNFITSRDYPPVARREGRDGLVLVDVYLDESGAVRDVRLIEGAYDLLNEVAVSKLREARFTPAYDRAGRPVACQVTVPIRFRLQ